MTTITRQLADALRELNDARYVLIDALKQSNYADKTTAFHDAFDNAREAIAAYDAQQAAASKAGHWRVLSPALPVGNYWADHPPVIGLESGEVMAVICDESDSRAPHLNDRAARIVQCVNAHDALVSALRDIIAYCVESVPESPCHADLDTLGGKARDALAQAGVTP